MFEAHPITNKIYQFPEFDFLVNPHPKWVNHLNDFDPDLIVGIVNTTQISSESLPPQIGINPSYIENLFKIARRSMVGRGHETIYDEDIRASSEIPSEYITIYPQFMDYIRAAVSSMALQLGNPTTVEPRFYKLVLYREGDHFVNHIDNEHEENMIMTLSVEFPVSRTTLKEEKYLQDVEKFKQSIGATTSKSQSIKDYGGDLVIEGKIVPHPNNKQLGLTLFYHDTKHNVTEVNRGYRMSLIFDVIHNPYRLYSQIIQQYLPSFQEGIQKLRDRGVKRIGSPANHIYIISENILVQNMSWKNLKGMDRIFWELLRTINQNAYIENIALNGNMFYFGTLISIMDLEDGFGSVYNYRGEEAEEEAIIENYTSIGDDAPIRKSQPKAITAYGEISLNFDNVGVYRAITPKYKMGNVVLLKSGGNLRLEYYGNEEIYTGNESFNGQIYSNLGIFVDI